MRVSNSRIIIINGFGLWGITISDNFLLFLCGLGLLLVCLLCLGIKANALLPIVLPLLTQEVIQRKFTLGRGGLSKFILQPSIFLNNICTITRRGRGASDVGITLRVLDIGIPDANYEDGPARGLDELDPQGKKIPT